MVDQQGFSNRLGKFRATKTQVFWACAACVVATMIVGFTWGGWVTGGNARDMASKASTGARAELAAAICLHQFVSAPDASAQLASLKAIDSWKRNDFIDKGGWSALPGVEKPVPGSAELCARQLMDAQLPLIKAAGAAG